MVPRGTLGDSGSLAKLGEASTGLAPWEATVSTVHADPALHPQWGQEDGDVWYEFHFPHLLGSGIPGQHFLVLRL